MPNVFSLFIVSIIVCHSLLLHSARSCHPLFHNTSLLYGLLEVHVFHIQRGGNMCNSYFLESSCFSYVNVFHMLRDVDFESSCFFHTQRGQYVCVNYFPEVHVFCTQSKGQYVCELCNKRGKYAECKGSLPAAFFFFSFSTAKETMILIDVTRKYKTQINWGNTP